MQETQSKVSAVPDRHAAFPPLRADVALSGRCTQSAKVCRARCYESLTYLECLQVTVCSRNAASVSRPRSVRASESRPEGSTTRVTANRRLLHYSDPSLVVCDFPTEEERRKPVGGGKVYALEAKIQALERKLADAERRAAGGYVPSPRATPVPSTQGMPQLPLRLDDGQVRASPQPRPQTAASLTETKPMIGPERTPRSRHASVGGQPYLPSGEPLRPLYLAHLETGVGPPSAAASTSSAGASTSYAGFALASATKSNVASPFTHHPPYLAEVPGSASTGPVSAAPSFAFPQAHLEPPSPSGQTNGYSGKGILSGHPAFGASPTYALMGPVSHPISTGPSEPAPFSDPPPLGSPAIQMSGAAPPHRMGPSATTGAPVAATVPSGPRLPSYSTLSRLVNVFFDYPHEAIDLINRRRFMAAFECPPDHPEYPAECLLHAMVATATDLAGLDAWEGEERYWNEGQSPAVFHADLAEVSANC